MSKQEKKFLKEVSKVFNKITKNKTKPNQEKPSKKSKFLKELEKTKSNYKSDRTTIINKLRGAYNGNYKNKNRDKKI